MALQNFADLDHFPVNEPTPLDPTANIGHEETRTVRPRRPSQTSAYSALVPDKTLVERFTELTTSWLFTNSDGPKPKSTSTEISAKRVSPQDSSIEKLKKKVSEFKHSESSQTRPMVGDSAPTLPEIQETLRASNSPQRIPAAGVHSRLPAPYSMNIAKEIYPVTDASLPSQITKSQVSAVDYLNFIRFNHSNICAQPVR